MSDTTDPLAECRDELRSVEEENDQLRASANAFADLAERLKASLERERRMKGQDPRSEP
jgi:hypothetical protein